MKERIAALEAEVEFLRKLVLELSKKQVVIQPSPVYPNPTTPQPYTPPYNPYMIGDPMAPYTPKVSC